MSKFFKKSLAVLTTAAIFATTTSIVAYAADASITIKTSDTTNIKLPSKFSGIALDDNIKIEVKKTALPDGKILACDSDTDGVWLKLRKAADQDGVTEGYIFFEGKADSKNAVADDTTVTFNISIKDDDSMDYDGIVWINGKDTKAVVDKTTKKVTNPALLYKTEEKQVSGYYAGGKWAVAVTPATKVVENETVEFELEDFLKCFDGNGKIDKNSVAAKTKSIATAKLKEGVVTVAAGKEAGEVKVWIYETNNKKILASSAFKNGALKTGLKESFADVKGIDPIDVFDGYGTWGNVEVKVAGASLVIADPADVKDNTVYGDKGLDSKVKAAKPTLLFKNYAEATPAEEKVQDTTTLYILEKKGILDLENELVVYGKDTEKGEVADPKGKLDYSAEFISVDLVALTEDEAPGYNADASGKESEKALEVYALEITPKKAGKTTVNILNKQSGKVAKLAVEVKDAFLVEADGVKLTYKGADKKTDVTIDGTATEAAKKSAWVLKDTVVKVSDDCKVGTTDVKKDKTFKVTANVKAAKAAAAPTTPTYTDPACLTAAVTVSSGTLARTGDKAYTLACDDSVAITPTFALASGWSLKGVVSGTTATATVNASGKITPVAAGTSTITYTFEKSGDTDITVTIAVTVTAATGG